MNYTPEKLKQFEQWVVKTFNEGYLKSPVHLSGSKDNSQEENLIRIFKEIKPNDWVASTYRSHYHALLKGIDENWLKQWILNNKSIHVMNKEHKFITSAIVGGTLPIALGISMALKMKNSNDKIYVFIGDMTSQTGIFNEVFKYAINFKLPIKFIVECNFLSTDTDTAEVWGIARDELEDWLITQQENYSDYFDYYVYERIYPHYGTGVFVDKIWSKEDVKAKGF